MTHPEEMSTIFSKQAAALSAQNDPSQIYRSSPKIAVLSEPGDSDLHGGAGMERNVLAYSPQEESRIRKSVSAKRTSPNGTLLRSPGPTVRPERRRISSRSRYERMLKNDLWMSQNGALSSGGYY